MKKIVINECYGGFSLSYDAVLRFAELKGVNVFGYVSLGLGLGRRLGLGRGKNYEYEKYCPKKHERGIIHYATVDKDRLTNKEINDAYWKVQSRYMDRDDADLIKVVEELGDKANGNCAKLKIVEIPDNVNWVIEEYDGAEWITEKHRSWS